MLTEKTKTSIENFAIKMQDELDLKEPNKYDLVNIVTFINNMGCEVQYNSESSCYAKGEDDKSIIYLSFKKPEDTKMNEDYVHKLRVVFHEIWHFIFSNISDDSETVKRYTEESSNLSDILANFFTRAMLLPMETFVDIVIKNIDQNGMCNIFKVAEFFNVNYTDVIARGNDLNIWNKKGGM